MSPVLKFSRFYANAEPPRPATRDAMGTLPIRAVRYCEAVASASAFGFLLFPPGDIGLKWDGDTIFYSTPEIEEWTPVDDVAPFPGFPETWKDAAPEALRDFAPSMLTALPEPGLIQVQFGLCATLTPGWGLLIRSPVNFPSSGYVHFDGIAEPSHWHGPLFINLRLTRTDTPIRLHSDRPLAQVQPIPHAAYAHGISSTTEDMDAAAWEGYRISVAEPHAKPDRPFGEVAVKTRRDTRGGCPFNSQEQRQ